MPDINRLHRYAQKRVKDGLMRPFQRGSVNMAWMTDALNNKWSALRWAIKIEQVWIDYLGTITNSVDSNSLIVTPPAPGYTKYSPPTTEVLPASSYKATGEIGANSGMILQYTVDISAVSVGDIWFFDPDEPGIVKAVFPAEKKIEVLGLTSKAIDSFGVGLGAGNVKTGVTLGNFVSAYMNLSPTGNKFLKYNVTNAQNPSGLKVFRIEEEIEEVETGKKAVVASSDGVKQIFFKSDPKVDVLPVPPAPAPPPPISCFSVDTIEPITIGTWRFFKLDHGQEIEHQDVSIIWVAGDTAYTMTDITGYSQAIPSGLRNPFPAESATYVEVIKPTGEFTPGNTLRGNTSGTTATIVSRDTSEDIGGESASENEDIRNAIKMMIGVNFCPCKIGTVTPPLPVIVL